MAINILSIPLMSNTPERVFSGARRTKVAVISLDNTGDSPVNTGNVHYTTALYRWF
jgi:Cys-tRNA synthase (O-phospho-L-seryl-tRNA:Cys-tRNA synthase)